jgi:hypothetical protein
MSVLGTLEPKGEEVKGNRRELLNEELHCVSSKPQAAIMKSRKMRWVGGYVARLGEK